LLTLRGVLAGTPGQRLTIVSVGAGQIDLANQDSSSSAANRIITGLTGTISLAATAGRAVLQYDGTSQRWRVVEHDQGTYISPAFSSGDFTANGSMTWSVDSGDVLDYSYYLIGRRLLLNVYINNTTVGGTANTTLLVKIPGGFTATRSVNMPIRVNDGSGAIQGLLASVSSQTNLQVFRALNLTTNWSLTTNATGVFGMLEFEVQ
jgi:hypothetical protein